MGFELIFQIKKVGLLVFLKKFEWSKYFQQLR